MTSNTDSSALCHFFRRTGLRDLPRMGLNRFDRVFTVGFDYGQRHHVEMECRRNVLNAVRSDASLPASWAARLGEDTLLSLGLFNQIGETAMTSDMEIAFNEQGIPNTFVPGRNLVFLTAAAALAWRKGIRHLVMGVCETDFPAIPTAATTPSRPCRSPSTSAWTPVSSCIPPDVAGQGPHMDPRRAGRRRAFVECVRTVTHTCYIGDRGELHPWGYGCGQCPACKLREHGWKEYSEGK